MQIKEFSSRVLSFKLAAALEKYEMDLRALGTRWCDAESWHRLQRDFGELRILGASLPRLAAAWVALLVSHTRLLQAVGDRTAPVRAMLDEHLSAIEGVRQRCLRSIGAQVVTIA